MKRRIFKLALFLLLGAIINVAVALVCAFNLPSAGVRSPDRYVEQFPSQLTWLDPICLERKDEVKIYEVQRFGGLLYQASPRNWPLDRPPPYIMDWQVIESGWPCLSLRGHWWMRTSLDPQVVSDPPILRGLYHFVRSGHEYREIPCFVSPVGFAIDTIFYSAILWLPFAAFGRIRRRRRLQRSLCPACAYPVGDSAVCTECGKAVKP